MHSLPSVSYTHLDVYKRQVENASSSRSFPEDTAARSSLSGSEPLVCICLLYTSFGEPDFEEAGAISIKLPEVDEYTRSELLAMEKETAGLYLSGHPMDEYRAAVRRAGIVPCLLYTSRCV